MNAITVGVLAYVVLQLGVAFVVSRRIRSEEDYLVAGRSLGFGMAMFTVFATWFGAETCVGAAAKAFEGGFAETNADPFGYTLCLLLMGLVFAIPFYRAGITTMADLFRKRWGAGVEKLAALLLIPSSILWAAAQIRAFGIVLGTTSTISIDVMIVVAGAVVIVYSATGGLWADAITDLVQGSVLIAGLVLVAISVATSGDPGFGAITTDQLALVDPGRPILETLEGWAVPIFGSVVAQELVARVIAAKNETVARRAVLSASALYFVIGIIPPLLGLVAVRVLPEGTDGEQVLALMAQRYLPSVLFVLFAGALVSAILSTVDSALLAAGALLAHNVLLPLRGGEVSERGKVLVNRLAVVGFGVIACGLALSAEGVYELVETASSLGTSGVLWVVVFGLWTKRFGGPAAAVACLIGGVTTYSICTLALDVAFPYLTSVAVSLALYLGVAIAEKAAGRE